MWVFEQYVLHYLQDSIDINENIVPSENFDSGKLGKERTSFVSLAHPELFYAAHIPLCTCSSPFNFADLGRSFSICVPGHIRSRNPCSHTKCHTPMHTCICEHISHTHLYPHTSLCLSLRLFLAPHLQQQLSV